MVKISKLIRAKRKTLSIMVMPNGEVVVKAPIGLSDEKIYAFLEEKQKWITTKQAKIETNNNRFSDVISYKKVMYLGKIYTGIFTDNVSKITLGDNYLYVPAKYNTDKINKKLISWYKKQAETVLITCTTQISEQVYIKPTMVKITDSRGRWGACNNKHQIFLNWRCIMLPPHLLDYVIVHELSHILELNHSPKFWAIVNKILPDSSKRKAEMKNYGFLLKMF